MQSIVGSLGWHHLNLIHIHTPCTTPLWLWHATLLNCGSVAQVSSGRAESESLLEKMVKESRILYCYWALFFLLSAEVKHPTYNEQHKHVLKYVLITGRYAQLATCPGCPCQDCQHKLVLLLFINPHCSSYKITHCNNIIGNVDGSRDQFASITCSLLSPTHNVTTTCKMTRGPVYIMIVEMAMFRQLFLFKPAYPACPACRKRWKRGGAPSRWRTKNLKMHCGSCSIKATRRPWSDTCVLSTSDAPRLDVIQSARTTLCDLGKDVGRI